jgi:hypothetical protein
MRFCAVHFISIFHTPKSHMKIVHDEGKSFAHTISSENAGATISAVRRLTRQLDSRRFDPMETITIALKTEQADRLYAAVGRHLAKGDVPLAEGQSQFATALAAVCCGTLGVLPAIAATPTPSPIDKAFTKK